MKKKSLFAIGVAGVACVVSVFAFVPAVSRVSQGAVGATQAVGSTAFGAARTVSSPLLGAAAVTRGQAQMGSENSLKNEIGQIKERLNDKNITPEEKKALHKDLKQKKRELRKVRK